MKKIKLNTDLIYDDNSIVEEGDKIRVYLREDLMIIGIYQDSVYSGIYTGVSHNGLNESK